MAMPFLTRTTSQSPDDKPIIRLSCSVKSYPYGKKGSRSLAARFAAATPENTFVIDEEQEYGEVCPSAVITPAAPPMGADDNRYGWAITKMAPRFHRLLPRPYGR